MAAKRTKQQIINRMNQVGYTTRFCNGSCPVKRVENIGEIDKEGLKVPFVLISNNNAGERYDWWEDETYIEELSIDGANIESLRTFFKDHRLSIDNAIGRVDNIVKDIDIRADVFFGTDSDSLKIFQKYSDGILSDVSVGYFINDIVVTEKRDEPTHILVTDYEIVELSAVWRGFDQGAGRGAKTTYDSRDINLLKKKLELKGKRC